MERFLKKNPTALFQQALKSIHDEEMEIFDSDLKPVGGNGVNYCSDVYKCSIQYGRDKNMKENQQEIQFFIKDLFENICDMEDIRLKEYTMYSQILPKMEELMNAKRPKQQAVRFAPKCFLASREQGELYIFEDLTALGFELKNRWEGFNVQHTRLIIKKLGQFHAASMVLAEKYPELIEQLGYCQFHKGAAEINAKMVVPFIKAAANYLSSQKLYEEISEKMLKLIPKFGTKLQETVDFSKSRFKVINHADLWLNNIMIKSHKNSEKEETIFLDYQLCFYGSPALDLNYFIHTSAPLDQIKTQRDQLLRLYFDNLEDTLHALEYPLEKIPSFDDLLVEIRQTEFYTFYAVTSELPLSALNPELSKGMNLDNLMDETVIDGMSDKLFQSKRVQEILKYNMARLNDLGELEE